MKKVMLTRIITGAFILLFTVAFVLLKQVSPLFFDAFVLIISVGAIYEINKAYKNVGKKVNWILLIFATLSICLINIFVEDVSRVFIYDILLAMILFVALMLIDIIVFAVNRKNGTTEPDASVLNSTLFDQTKFTMMSFAYPVLLISSLYMLNHLPYDIGYMGIIVSFAVSMLTDTCALFVGVACGKRKFVPEVSPKKSVAGVVGGLIGGVIGAGLCFVIFYFTNWFALDGISLLKSILAFAIVGVIGSFINQLGDLVSSALKRKVGLKDFAHIFPEHGGFMDRVDGLMFVSTFVYVIFSLLLV